MTIGMKKMSATKKALFILGGAAVGSLIGYIDGGEILVGAVLGMVITMTRLVLYLLKKGR